MGTNGLSAEEALAAARKYTAETVIGGGALKGKNCIIQSITEITGGHRVTFKWTLDDGTVETETMDVMDGRPVNKFIYMAHRGVTNDGEYDNTVKAIQNAVDCGYEWCEIDVVPTADGTLVLSHGRNVTLYDNGVSVTISDLWEETYDDLKNYTWDAAGLYPIDTLDKVLFTFKHQNINFVLDCASVTRDNVMSVFEKIADYGMRDRCILGAPSSVLYPYFNVERINKDFSDIALRITYSNDSSYNQAIENLKNPIYLDAHYSSGISRQPQFLSYRKPILVYGFYKHNRSAADEADMQKWVNFAAGVMAKYSEDLDDLEESVKFNYGYSDITMDTSIINLTDEHPTSSLSAENETAGGGYINMYMTDYAKGNITSLSIGETTTGTLTMNASAPTGTMEIRAFNGSCEKVVPVNVAKNNLIPIVGDHNPDTHKYTANGQKITWFSLYGTVADGKTIANSDRYMYSKAGFLGEFYESPIPAGATQLDITVDTSKVSGGKTYVSIFDADGTRVVQDSWSATHSIPILPTYKTFVINGIYDGTRPAFNDNIGNFGYRTNAKYDEMVDAVSISFTISE